MAQTLLGMVHRCLETCGECDQAAVTLSTVNHFLVPSFFFLVRFSQCWSVSFTVHVLGPLFLHIIPNLVPERFHDFFVLPLPQNTRDRRGQLL